MEQTLANNKVLQAWNSFLGTLSGMLKLVFVDHVVIPLGGVSFFYFYMIFQANQDNPWVGGTLGLLIDFGMKTMIARGVMTEEKGQRVMAFLAWLACFILPFLVKLVPAYQTGDVTPTDWVLAGVAPVLITIISLAVTYQKLGKERDFVAELKSRLKTQGERVTDLTNKLNMIADEVRAEKDAEISVKDTTITQLEDELNIALRKLEALRATTPESGEDKSSPRTTFEDKVLFLRKKGKGKLDQEFFDALKDFKTPDDIANKLGLALTTTKQKVAKAYKALS